VSRPARPEPGVAEVRLSGAAEGHRHGDLSAGAAGGRATSVTTVRLEILHCFGARANRRAPEERTYVLVRITAAGTGASGPGSAP